MIYRPVVALLGAAVLTTAASASAAPAASDQPSSPSDPIVVVESFLLARDAQDPLGATALVAPVIALHDADGEWFVDPPTMSDWLRQLTNKYLIDTMRTPLATGNSVTWTERLTPRSIRFPESLASSITLDVHAVVQDGKITALAAPYPPLAFRSPATPAVFEEALVSQAGTGSSPAALFVGSALGLALTYLLVGKARATWTGYRRGRI